MGASSGAPTNVTTCSYFGPDDANDIVGSTADNQRLLAALASETKAFIEIPDGSHYIFFEKASVPFYEAVRKFLEPAAE